MFGLSPRRQAGTEGVDGPSGECAQHDLANQFSGHVRPIVRHAERTTASGTVTSEAVQGILTLLV